MKKIALIYTTFLRDKLMFETVKAILDHWQYNYELYIADQGDEDEIKDAFIEEISLMRFANVHYFKLDFDCGLSYARNFLVKQAQARGCDYCLLLADSLKVNADYDFTDMIEFLESDKNNGIVGLDDIGRPSWERNIDLIPQKYFYLSKTKSEVFQYKSINLQNVEICRNFFLAKTQCLVDNPWDNELKMAEHEDFFWRLKTNTQYKVFYSDSIKCAYIDYKPSIYMNYRMRLYNTFIRKLRSKYNISGWVKYEK